MSHWMCSKHLLTCIRSAGKEVFQMLCILRVKQSSSTGIPLWKINNNSPRSLPSEFRESSVVLIAILFILIAAESESSLLWLPGLSVRGRTEEEEEWDVRLEFIGPLLIIILFPKTTAHSQYPDSAPYTSSTTRHPAPCLPSNALPSRKVDRVGSRVIAVVVAKVVVTNVVCGISARGEEETKGGDNQYSKDREVPIYYFVVVVVLLLPSLSVWSCKVWAGKRNNDSVAAITREALPHRLDDAQEKEGIGNV